MGVWKDPQFKTYITILQKHLGEINCVKYNLPPMGGASISSCADIVVVVALSVVQNHILMYWSLPLSKVQLA